jgi:hypothetical protein
MDYKQKDAQDKNPINAYMGMVYDQIEAAGKLVSLIEATEKGFFKRSVTESCSDFDF